MINRFAGNGVLLSGSSVTGNEVQGNFIGTNAAGSAILGNGDDFSCVTNFPVGIGQPVTATATNTSGTGNGTSIGDTSEFSLNDDVVAGS